MTLCKKCGCIDPLAFYSYLPGECKECTRKRVRSNREKRIEYYRAFDRQRGKTTGRKASVHAKNKRKRKTMGPNYDKAHNAIARAVESGKVIRPSSCQRCPSAERIHAHHDDHAKPFDVMWLCPVCHAARHKELGRLVAMAKFYGDHQTVTGASL